MGHKNYLLVIFFAISVLISNVSAEETAKAEKKGPVAVISNANFMAEPVIEGNDIIHTYVVKNTGTETLSISRVKTG
jgi:hypothetical protein